MNIFYSILLRMPFIFIIDEVLKIRFGLPELFFQIFNGNKAFMIGANSEVDFGLSIFKLIVFCSIFCSSILILGLPDKYLNLLYWYVISKIVHILLLWCANLFLLHDISNAYKNFNLDDNIVWNVEIVLQPPVMHFILIIFHCITLQFIQLVIFELLYLKHSINNVLRFSYLIIPTLIALTTKTQETFHLAAVLLTLVPFFIILCLKLPSIQNIIHEGIDTKKYYHEIFFMNAMENRAHIPNFLRIFWIIRVLILYLLSIEEIKNKTMYETIKYILTEGCDTLPAILGMTSFVSYYCYYIEVVLRWLLLSNDDRSIGSISAALFIMMALQSGLTGLEPEKRYTQLCQNVCLLTSELLHPIYEHVYPLSNIENNSFTRRLRFHLAAIFLILFPISMLIYLWSYYSVSCWLLEVSCYNISIAVKQLMLLTVHSLLLIDLHHQRHWDGLDDYVYYIEAFGNIVVFCLYIFICMINTYVIIFVSHSIARALMIYVHTHENIWGNFKIGWAVFIKRRIAMKKVQSLPEATSIQLKELNDFCSICCQRLESAKITKCNHYFHSSCLLKWFYTKDQCLLCHNIAC